MPAPWPITLRIHRQTLPAEALHRCRNAPLIGSPDLRDFNIQALFGDLANRLRFAALKVLGNHLLPGVRLEPGLLLGLDVLALEGSIGPPLRALLVEVHCFRKELIAVPFERICVYRPSPNRPETTPPGLVPQVNVL